MVGKIATTRVITALARKGRKTTARNDSANMRLNGNMLNNRPESCLLGTMCSTATKLSRQRGMKHKKLNTT